MRSILVNPIYIGLGIRCRTASGIYYIPTAKGSQPSKVEFEELANNAHVKLKMRPRDEWIEMPQPHLAESLPEELRELARLRINQHLESIADGKSKKAHRDPHLQSLFWLKDYLKSKQGKHRMTGRRGGKGGNIRTYGVARGLSAPKRGNVLARRIPAAALEAAVMALIREIVMTRPDLEEAIKRIVAKEIGQRNTDRERQAYRSRHK